MVSILAKFSKTKECQCSDIPCSIDVNGKKIKFKCDSMTLLTLYGFIINKLKDADNLSSVCNTYINDILEIVTGEKIIPKKEQINEIIHQIGSVYILFPKMIKKMKEFCKSHDMKKDFKDKKCCYGNITDKWNKIGTKMINLTYCSFLHIYNIDLTKENVDLLKFKVLLKGLLHTECALGIFLHKIYCHSKKEDMKNNKCC